MCCDIYYELLIIIALFEIHLHMNSYITAIANDIPQV